ncbi:receptor-type guanylate cyclase Gyc76C, partial [Caerostris extrusa]
LLWRAPELLRDPKMPPVGQRWKGDVYSFGIILYEIIARSGPFGQIDVKHHQVSKLKTHSIASLIACKSVGQKKPDDRSDFKTIRTKLRPMRKGMKPNIFDNMLAMMEKYANNLEAFSEDERTDQLRH